VVSPSIHFPALRDHILEAINALAISLDQNRVCDCEIRPPEGLARGEKLRQLQTVTVHRAFAGSDSRDDGSLPARNFLRTLDRTLSDHTTLATVVARCGREHGARLLGVC
jgi:hypothetical protein